LGQQTGPSHSSAERLIDKEGETGASAAGSGSMDFNLYSEMLPPDLARQLMMGQFD
jgi:hypothetical protein